MSEWLNGMDPNKYSILDTYNTAAYLSRYKFCDNNPWNRKWYIDAWSDCAIMIAMNERTLKMNDIVVA